MQKVTLENETKVGLLYALKDFTTETVKGLLFPVKRQKQDDREPPSAGRRRCFWRGCRT